MQVPGKRVAVAVALAAGLLAGAVVGGCGQLSARAHGAATDYQASGLLKQVPAGLAEIPRSQISVVDLNFTAEVSPATLVIAQDGTLEKLHWSHWGGRSASATGALNALICTSSCAAGHHVLYRASVVLSDPVTCENRRYYNVATATINTVKGTRQWGSFLHAPCKPQPLVYH